MAFLRLNKTVEEFRIRRYYYRFAISQTRQWRLLGNRTRCLNLLSLQLFKPYFHIHFLYTTTFWRVFQRFAPICPLQIAVLPQQRFGMRKLKCYVLCGIHKQIQHARLFCAHSRVEHNRAIGEHFSCTRAD